MMKPTKTLLFFLGLFTISFLAKSQTFYRAETGTTYKLTHVTTWWNAYSRALSEGGNLVTVNDASEQAWLYANIVGVPEFWTGFTDHGSEGRWRWVSGEPVTYTNWNRGEPNNSHGAEHYGVLMRWVRGYWNDAPNSTWLMPGLIEFESVLPPDNEAPVANAGDDQTIHTGVTVNLSGAASHDPDENYPLTYLWEIIERPEGSEAELDDPTIVNPWFVPDIPGEYIIELVVTDDLELESEPDTVVISTNNTPPVADAGPDLALLALNTPVQLGTEPGRQSYDPDGDIIDYAWEIIERPEGSLAELDNPTSPTPSMLADQYGTYEVRLIVFDPWTESEPDTVLISFENIPPVACTNGNQSRLVDEVVNLDGSCSTDANNDPLAYHWQLVSAPSGSQAQIIDQENEQASFLADLPGTFVVSLIVSDGEFISDPPATSTIYVAGHPNAVIDELQDVIDTINLLPPNSLKNKNSKNPLTNKINAAIEMIDLGLYEDALDKLENDILKKTDGCANTGRPDRNDWITTCQAQELIYPGIVRAIIILNDLL